MLAHSHVTIFTVDPERQVTMLEGALIWNSATEDNHERSRWFVGENMYTVFNRLTEQAPDGERAQWLQPIEDILGGRTNEDVKEHGIGKLLPQKDMILMGSIHGIERPAKLTLVGRWPLVSNTVPPDARKKDKRQ